jgi:hypothetical protein
MTWDGLSGAAGLESDADWVPETARRDLGAIQTSRASLLIVEG